jgi:FkbM family methyltransferase
MYRALSDEALPEWTKGIASVNPDHHKISGIDESYMKSETVDGVTFDTLFSKYNVTNVDLLQVDTEGYDKEILKMFPFERIKPSIIHFEHALGDSVMSVDDFLSVTKLLIGQGYKLITKQYDCIAYL